MPPELIPDILLANSLKISENIDLAPLTTLKIGGRARLFTRAENEAQVALAVKYAAVNSLSLFVLGGGSNVLISDRGFDGLVVQIGIRGIEACEISETKSPSDQISIRVGAGEDWDSFVEYCIESDLSGLECLSGIPGLVGGTPVQNVGAYGQEVSETISSVWCFDRNTHEFITLAGRDCGFSYRTSIFNSSERERYIVLNVTFSLKKNGKPKIVYKDLAEHFRNSTPTLSEVREAVLAIRRSKSMVIDPNDPNTRSAGSFFKNPIVDPAKLTEIRASFPNAPAFPFEDKVKIPAAWLIEHAGFEKGFHLAGAGISTKHTLALINRRDATAAQIIDLKDTIQARVSEKFGIPLIPEPVFIGF